MRPLFLTALALLSTATIGCGSGATVSGKVFYEGRPVTSGSIVLLNQDGTAASGAIQPDGSYAVAGVPKGTVRIGVLSANPARDPRRKRSVVKDKVQGWFPLPRNVGDPASSGLVCDVDARRVRHDIELK